jgi:hypothetical protein
MGDKRISRHSKGSSLFLTKWQKLALMDCACMNGILGDLPFDDGTAFESVKEAEATWKANSKQLTEEYIQKNPGLRPMGWRRFEFPEVKTQIVGQSGWWDQHKIYCIVDEYERFFECLKRTGHLKPTEVIPQFDLDEVKLRTKRIAQHEKLMKENPPEKTEKHGRQAEVIKWENYRGQSNVE